MALGNLSPLPVTLREHENSFTPPPPPPPALPVEQDHDQSAAARRTKKKMRSLILRRKTTVKKIPGWFMIFATLTAALSYNAALNPPGGFWQDDSTPSPDLSFNTPNAGITEGRHTASNPVLADTSPVLYYIFFICNANAFVMSLAIIVLLLINQGFLRAEVRLALVNSCMIGVVFTLVLAFAAGSVRNLLGIIYVGLALVCNSLCLTFFGPAYQEEIAGNAEPGEGS